MPASYKTYPSPSVASVKHEEWRSSLQHPRYWLYYLEFIAVVGNKDSGYILLWTQPFILIPARGLDTGVWVETGVLLEPRRINCLIKNSRGSESPGGGCRWLSIGLRLTRWFNDGVPCTARKLWVLTLPLPQNRTSRRRPGRQTRPSRRSIL